MKSVTDVWDVTLTYTYDLADNRTGVADSFGGFIGSTYDAANRLTQRTFEKTGGVELRLDFSYTVRDQLEAVIRYADLAGQNVVGSSVHNYDTEGRRASTEHRGPTGTPLIVYGWDYDLAGRLEEERLEGVAVRTFGYDVTNQLTDDNGSPLSYDLNGNRTMTGYVVGPFNQLLNDGTWSYSYDAEGNLVGKTQGPGYETWTYGYGREKGSGVE